MGTSQLLSVPYALYAENAENVENVEWDDIDNKPTSLTEMGIDNPVNTTIKSVNCHTLASVTDSYQKVGDIATFSKLNASTSV